MLLLFLFFLGFIVIGEGIVFLGFMERYLFIFVKMVIFGLVSVVG